MVRPQTLSHKRLPTGRVAAEIKVPRSASSTALLIESIQLPIMRKWLLIFLCVSALVVSVVLVTCKYQRGLEDKERTAAELARRSTVSQSDGSNTAKESCDCTPKTPCWYLLLTWPEGITAWAIILTFAVIGWQADETRKAASAAEEQSRIANSTLIAQFRPRVIVRSIILKQNKTYFDGNDGQKLFRTDSWTVELLFVNVGGTGAQVLGVPLEIRWRDTPALHRYQPLHGAQIEGFPLGAGRENLTSIVVPNGGLFGSKIAVSDLELKARKSFHAIQVVGIVCYVDGSSIERKTGFVRNLNLHTMRFTPSTNPEEEYQD
jgi:hypothetical protein